MCSRQLKERVPKTDFKRAKLKDPSVGVNLKRRIKIIKQKILIKISQICFFFEFNEAIALWLKSVADWKYYIMMDIAVIFFSPNVVVNT